jgi:formate-nitrite transporter family protein
LKKFSKSHQPTKMREERAHAERQIKPITEKEAEDVEQKSSLRTPVIYEIVRKLGDEEMDRPIMSLWWSGVAAGLSISFSLLAQATLQSHLPQSSWTLLITSLGYSVGFLMAVLSRQQLFTENTITAVLPVVANFTLANLWRLGRLWSVVLAANVVGTFVAAFLCTFTPVLTPELKAAMLDIASQITNHTWMEMTFRAIASGFLIAAMVWLIPGAETAQFHVIVFITYLIAAAGFMHIVAGSVEAFLLVLHGHLGVQAMVTDFFVPVLIGNIIGGTALFALIAYAQVMKVSGDTAVPQKSLGSAASSPLVHRRDQSLPLLAHDRGVRPNYALPEMRQANGPGCHHLRPHRPPMQATSTRPQRVFRH